MLGVRAPTVTYLLHLREHFAEEILAMTLLQIRKDA